MKYTKEQLQAMSDMQVLRKLYELLGFEVHEYEFEEVITIRHGDKVTTAEMCPNDIMPLAFEHDIAYLKTYKTAYCKIDGQKHKQHYTDESPLRAIACCLILVLQGEKE